MTDGKSFLIVTGVARSGTTTLAELLNAHPRICLGIERFKFRYLLEHDYSPEFFTRERFFDFRKEDTNLRPEVRPAWQPTYDAIAAKWDEAEVIGDKVPDLMPVLAEFMAANPDYKYICILRNLKDVGLSWQARADRPRDSWPQGKGFGPACESWAEQHEILHGMVRDRALRERLFLLDYDQMYADPALTEAALLGFLGVARDPAFRTMLDGHAEFVRTKKARKVPEQFAELYRAVDMGPIRGMRKIAREQMSLWADRFYKTEGG